VTKRPILLLRRSGGPVSRDRPGVGTAFGSLRAVSLPRRPERSNRAGPGRPPGPPPPGRTAGRRRSCRADPPTLAGVRWPLYGRVAVLGDVPADGRPARATRNPRPVRPGGGGGRRRGAGAGGRPGGSSTAPRPPPCGSRISGSRGRSTAPAEEATLLPPGGEPGPVPAGGGRRVAWGSADGEAAGRLSGSPAPPRPRPPVGRRSGRQRPGGTGPRPRPGRRPRQWRSA
jgi:hypothetical protein